MPSGAWVPAPEGCKEGVSDISGSPSLSWTGPTCRRSPGRCVCEISFPLHHVCLWCGAQMPISFILTPPSLAPPDFLVHLPQTPPLPPAQPLEGALKGEGTAGFMSPIVPTRDAWPTGGRPRHPDQVVPVLQGSSQEEAPCPPILFLTSAKKPWTQIATCSPLGSQTDMLTGSWQVTWWPNVELSSLSSHRPSFQLQLTTRWRG